MAEGTQENAINKILGNMTTSEHTYSTAASPEYANRTEAWDNDSKSNLIRVTEDFKRERNESSKEIQETTIK